MRDFFTSVFLKVKGCKKKSFKQLNFVILPRILIEDHSKQAFEKLRNVIQ